MNLYDLQAGVEARDDQVLKSIEQQAHEARVAANLRYERAQAIAHDPEELDRLIAVGTLDYSELQIKVDGQFVDLFGAAERLRLRVMLGRHAEADCIARDMTDRIAAECDRLLLAKAIR